MQDYVTAYITENSQLSSAFLGISNPWVKKYALLLPYDTDEEEIARNITYMGKRKHMHDHNYDDVQPMTCDFVPDDIDGTPVYIVSLQVSGKMLDLGGRAT